MARPVIVVPCYNEAERLLEGELQRLARQVDLYLVDDGSADATLAVIERIAAASDGRIQARANAGNRGKAETVRLHMLAACGDEAPSVGFLDADLATPVDDMIALMAQLEACQAEAVTGARVALSGRDIRRDSARHYSGRIFSTIASLAIGATYYDTQCGAKIFRNTTALRAALSKPFLSRWAFDVELLGRLLAGSPEAAPIAAGRLVEYPLQTWHDVAGSKLTLVDSWRSAAELFLIWRDLAQRRRVARSGSPRELPGQRA